MGKYYQHITIAERCEMARLQRAGYTKRQIAASLDRSTSTVTRELSRNSSQTKGYDPEYAQQQAGARRWRGARLDRNPALREQVLAGLQANWSPEQGRAGWPWKGAALGSPTRPSTASSMPREIAPKTMLGSACCPVARPNGAGASAREATPLPTFTYAAPWHSGLRRPPTAASPAIGKPT